MLPGVWERDMATIEGGCHCGAIRFTVPAPEALTACNCSYCGRTGALWAYCDPADFTLTAQAGAPATYTFNTGMSVHHHCATCGCATHGRVPGITNGMPDPTRPRIGWNARMAIDFDRSAVPVTHVNGRTDW